VAIKELRRSLGTNENIECIKHYVLQRNELHELVLHMLLSGENRAGLRQINACQSKSNRAFTSYE
jgi:hypothetical protein